MKVQAAAFPMPKLQLVHSRRKAEKVLRKLGCKTEFLETEAQMWLVGSNAIVLFEADCDWHSEAALLCHEAVHVADEWLKALGEDSPGTEERAYMVQCIAEPFFRAHEKWKRRRESR